AGAGDRPPPAGRASSARRRDREPQPAWLPVPEQATGGGRGGVLRPAGLAPAPAGRRVPPRARARPGAAARPGGRGDGRRPGPARREQPGPGGRRPAPAAQRPWLRWPAGTRRGVGPPAVAAHRGRRRLRMGRDAAARQAPVEGSGRQLSHLTGTDFGYAVAARLSAAGRLEDMALGIECLLSDDPARARELALMLEALNAERRAVQ